MCSDNITVLMAVILHKVEIVRVEKETAVIGVTPIFLHNFDGIIGF